MTNPNDPIDHNHSAVHTKGLTKREWFAGLAMQGVVSGRYASGDMRLILVEGKEVLAEVLKIADALIAELNKGPK